MPSLPSLPVWPHLLDLALAAVAAVQALDHVQGGDDLLHRLQRGMNQGDQPQLGLCLGALQGGDDLLYRLQMGLGLNRRCGGASVQDPATS